MLFLLGLIAASPAILLVDGPNTYGRVALVSAIGIGLATRAIRPGEAIYFYSFIRSILPIMAVPSIWLIIQVLPLQSLGISHPIWDSAAAAFGRPLHGSISIDPGATLICFVRYLSFAAIVLLAAIAAIDRYRAEWVLIALTAATTFTSALLVVHEVSGFSFLNNVKPAAMDCVLFGLIFSMASAVRVFERYETRRLRTPISLASLSMKKAAYATCFALACLAISFDANRPLLFVGCCGVTTFLSIVLIRRLGIGPWEYLLALGAAVFITLVVVVTNLQVRGLDVTLAFASGAPASLVSVTERILADRTWTGSGAGTFTALLPIYQNLGEVLGNSSAPTSAASMTIELGRPALIAALGIAIALSAMFFRGALRRGRDSFYSTTASSCGIVLSLVLFVNSGIFNTATLIIVAAAFGLGLAHNQSHSTS